MSIGSARQAIADVLARPGSGIATSRKDPPEGDLRGPFPLSFVNPLRGTVRPSASDRYWVHSVQVLAYVAPRKKDLPEEFATLDPVIEAVEAAIWDAYVNDEIPPGFAACWVERYETGLRAWEGETFHVVTFDVRVEEASA